MGDIYEAKNYYFTPGSFHTNFINLEWRHFLNNKGLFWGSNDTYYTVRYVVNFDVHDQIGHRLYTGFHHDWNNRLSTDMEWQKIIYEHPKTYGEERFVISLKYYF